MARRPARRRGRVTSREVVGERPSGVLQVGRPDPRARSVSQFQIEQLMRAAQREWPGQPITVAVFARWPYRGPREKTGSPLPRLRESYGEGHVPSLQLGRHYYGWRSDWFTFGSLRRPRFPVEEVVDEYRGRGPIRCVTAYLRGD